MPKLVLYSPFPDLDNEDQYKELGNYVNKGKIHPDTNLPLRFDPKAGAASFEKYRDHVEELERFKKIHVANFTKYFEGEKKEIKIESLTYEDSIKLKNKKDLFNTYTTDDIVFIHSHGNKHVIGTGGFTLSPEDLAKNISDLGLSKDNPPAIVAWSCQSGEDPMKKGEKIDKSYAENLHNALIDLGFKNIIVIGIPASIMINETTGRITYKEKITPEEHATRTHREKLIKPEDAVAMVMTPGKKESFELIVNNYDQLFTQIKKAQEIIINDEMHFTVNGSEEESILPSNLEERFKKISEVENVAATVRLGVKTRSSQEFSDIISNRIDKSDSKGTFEEEKYLPSPKEHIEAVGAPKIETDTHKTTDNPHP